MHCNIDVEILCEYYFGTHNEKEIFIFNIEWDRYKFGLISWRKKWFQLERNLSRNKLKPDINATKGFLKYGP